MKNCASIKKNQNDPCSTVSEGLTGTCMTSTECGDVRGNADGNCAAGEGGKLFYVPVFG